MLDIFTKFADILQKIVRFLLNWDPKEFGCYLLPSKQKLYNLYIFYCAPHSVLALNTFFCTKNGVELLICSVDKMGLFFVQKTETHI